MKRSCFQAVGLGLVILVGMGCGGGGESTPEVKKPSKTLNARDNEAVDVEVVEEYEGPIREHDPDQGGARDPGDTVDREERIPVMVKGNYIWSAAMNLAWNSIRDSIFHEAIAFEQGTESAISLAKKLNASRMILNDIGRKEGFVESGFGPEGIRKIKAAWMKKWPKTPLPELPEAEEMENTWIFTLAAFRANLAYLHPMTPVDVQFQGKWVKGFGLFDPMAKTEDMRILNYVSDDKFLLRLLVRNEEQELYVAKGYAMQSPDQVLKDLRRYGRGNLGRMVNEDRFEAPILKVEAVREYPELEHILLRNKGFEGHWIEGMREVIEFEMDEYGCRASTRASMLAVDSLGSPSPQPKNLLLDRPYWVVLKRRSSPRAYFILGVKNAAFMTASDGKNRPR